MKLLIANRGEIAVRIIRACREMGISTVAVYSEVDRLAPHVLMADSSFPIGPAPAAQSYLDMDKLLAAAAEGGADLLHPGEGCNEAFAREESRCQTRPGKACRDICQRKGGREKGSWQDDGCKEAPQGGDL